MADKITPPVKPVPKPSGMARGQTTLTTPDPCYGRLYGSGAEAKDARGNSSIMGKKSK